MGMSFTVLQANNDQVIVAATVLDKTISSRVGEPKLDQMARGRTYSQLHHDERLPEREPGLRLEQEAASHSLSESRGTTLFDLVEGKDPDLALMLGKAKFVRIRSAAST
jgi:hypothetical protein